MQINSQTANHLVEAAAEAVRARAGNFHAVLDDIPAAIYVADHDGTITYFNKACVDLAGRTPEIGVDKWCVTWKIFTPEGEYLPHDRCPMAIAIREKRPIRDVEAIAERPDGTRVRFIPHPTPLFDGDGNLSGAVNLLLEVDEQRKPEFLRKQAERCRRLAAAVNDTDSAETLALMAAKYDEQSLKRER